MFTYRLIWSVTDLGSMTAMRSALNTMQSTDIAIPFTPRRLVDSDDTNVAYAWRVPVLNDREIGPTARTRLLSERQMRGGRIRIPHSTYRWSPASRLHVLPLSTVPQSRYGM